MLFLGLEIARDRTVTRRPSFHHPAMIQGSFRAPSGFTYEFQDADRRVLDCGHLHCDCVGCGCGHSGAAGCICWPKTMRDAIPYPSGAARFIVYEGDKAIYEEAIPDPPPVKIERQQAVSDGIELTWSAPETALAFLVQIRDARARVWRGAAPRTEAHRIVIPWPMVRAARKLPFRVLATSGIATGYAETVPDAGDEMPPDATLTMVGARSTAEGPVRITAVPSILATDETGSQIPDAHIAWFDEQGRSLGRGRQVDLRQLPDGRHVVRAVVRGHGGRTVAKAWVIERRHGDFLLHAAICDPPRSPRGPGHQHPHPAPPRCKE